MVLAGVVPAPATGWLPLNLDKLVDEYDVEVTNERVLRVLKGDPNPQNDIRGGHQPRLVGQNPLATLFEGRPVTMNNVRVVRPRPAPPRGGRPPYQAVELLGTVSPVFQGSPVVAESDLGPPAQVIEDFFKKPRAELRGTVDELPAGGRGRVGVGHAGLRQPACTHARARAPRVEVFGDAGFVSNAALAGGGGEEEQAARSSTTTCSPAPWPGCARSRAAWASSRRTAARTPSGRRPTSSTWRCSRFGLMSLTIIGLGLGVWVARRS